MTDLSGIIEQFQRDGRMWLRGAISPTEVAEFARLAGGGSHPGARVSQDDPLYQAIAAAPFSARLAALWPEVRPVRLLSFAKSPEANWAVPWHQDRVIATARRVEAPGYGNWSRKAGGWHCEPPLALLERMLFVRVHLDPSTVENGAMEIALGSHRAGKVSTEEAADIAARHETELTIAEPGDVLVLAMLTLHRSSLSNAPGLRRALRVDYAPGGLPAELQEGAPCA
ncbi:MAG: phytanoyl-CoA dioxygenase family protein [Rhodobacteraceae bacterium]|nr:phytanoyl-CoA dioxygenase family protein [Paracoccaceae bacterium]